MLILILINAHYLQNLVSRFQESSNGQDHSLSDSHHPRFPTLLQGRFSPLKNTGDGGIDGGDIFHHLKNFSGWAEKFGQKEGGLALF